MTPAGALDSCMSPGVLTVSTPADTVARVCPAKKLILLKLSSSILLCLVSGLAFSSASRSLFSVAALFPQGLPPLSMMQMQLWAGRRGTASTNSHTENGTRRLATTSDGRGGNRCAPRDVRRRPAKILHIQKCRTSKWHKRPLIGTDTAADACEMLVGVVCAPGFSLETTNSAPKVRRRHALVILEETCGKPARFCRQRS